MSKKVARTDFILVDRTHVWWPGILPYRGESTPRGRGYRTYEEAAQRARRITDAYARKYGRAGGPDLRVVERSLQRS